VIYILATGSDEPQTSGELQNSEDCAQLSALSAQGQIDALSIGASFLALSIPAGPVLHNGSCIARDMALVAFGRGQGWVSPGEFLALLRGQRIAILRELLSTTPQPGMNTVLVGPGQDISDVTGTRFARGEAVVYKPLGKTGFSFVTRILPNAWEQLERSATGLVPVEPCVPDEILLEQLDPSFAPTAQPDTVIDQGIGHVQICRPVPSPTAIPELLLPDLITLPPTELSVRFNPVDEQKLLRFTNSILNIGQGKIELWGASNPDTGKVTVTQFVYNEEGSAEETVVGEFFFHPEHDHWHLGDFAVYEIWSLTPDGEFDSVVALSNKISYCLRDDARSDIPNAARGQTYTNCNQERQGISVGWIDIYRFNLEGQSIDISSLQDGVYALRSVVDPENHLREADSTNNAAILFFELEGENLSIVDPPG
jgi:hypothetical protein